MLLGGTLAVAERPNERVSRFLDLGVFPNERDPRLRDGKANEGRSHFGVPGTACVFTNDLLRGPDEGRVLV